MYSDKACKKSISKINNSGVTTFYIKVTDGTKIKNVTVNTSATVLNAKIFFLAKNDFWSGNGGKGHGQGLILIKPGESKQNKSVKFDVQSTGSLTINKTDADTGKSLSAGFKIQTSAGKWLSGKNGAYNYTNSFANAETYPSPVTLKDIKFDTYKIYEVKAPEGYDITAQKGYGDIKGEKNQKGVLCGTVKVDGNNIKVTKSFTNKYTQKISIKGYVWVDLPSTKERGNDNLYDTDLEGKARIEGVTVKLIKKSNNKVVATKKTKSNGEYTFDKALTKSELKDYYIEFDYKGKKKYVNEQNKEINEDISKYIPVAFNSTNKNKIVANGSRALMDEHAYEDYKDTKYTGIATTYKGPKEEKTYGLSGNLYEKLFNEKTATLENINLGIKKIPNEEFGLEENLEYVKITINGYNYTYNYGNLGNSNMDAAPKVYWQGKTDKNYYSAAIYPSDIMYTNQKDREKELKVYVGYKINIKNLSQTNIDELYKEKKLIIRELTDKFDTSRYELNDSNWTAKGNSATYKNKIELGPYKTETGEKSIPIQFEVKTAAIRDMLDKTNHPNGIIEDFPTEATAKGYHEYTRNDYSWKNLDEGTKKNPQEKPHRTEEKEQSDKAPYLVFRLGKERIIRGKVFEDKVVTTDGQKLGNGQYDSNENVVKDVTVELLDVDGKNLARLYQEDKISEYNANKDNYLGIEATTKTVSSGNVEENGHYEFRGIVPGYYYLRFTYGDGTQKICDLSGNEIKTLTAKDYKSTIVTNEDVKNALKNVTTDGLWYKKLGNTGASVAIDDLTTRKALNNGNGTGTNIMAGTAIISITVEKENTPTNTSNMQVATDGKIVELASNVFNGLNFGIIEMPTQSAKIEKLITNMNLENPQNGLIFNGNPVTDSLMGVSDLDELDTNDGSRNVRAELKDELIYGSKLELTYAIKVTNTSDVNYYNDDYYFYGTPDVNKEVTLIVKDLDDYLDNTLTYNKEASGSKFEEIQIDPNLAQDDELAQKTVLRLSDWNTKLYTINNTARTKNVYTSKTATLVAYRPLSDKDDDMEFINKATVSSAKNGLDDKDIDGKEDQLLIYKAADSKFEVADAITSITPPTGADRQAIIIYTIAGTIALAMLSAGVVVIKKYIVK